MACHSPVDVTQTMEGGSRGSDDPVAGAPKLHKGDGRSTKEGCDAASGTCPEEGHNWAGKPSLDDETLPSPSLVQIAPRAHRDAVQVETADMSECQKTSVSVLTGNDHTRADLSPKVIYASSKTSKI